MVMAWSLQGELRFPLATFHYHSLPPAYKERKLRLSFLQAHCDVVRIYSTEERRLHTTCLETAKKAMESFGLFE